jgi:hypothetical protein
MAHDDMDELAKRPDRFNAEASGGSKAMKKMVRAAPWLLAFVILAGCASTKMTSQQPYTGAALPRPDRIIV